VQYSHKEFGYYFQTEELDEAQWYPIGNPHNDAAIYVAELNAGIVAIPRKNPDVFRRVQFKYRRA